jgi:hypothetical protein
MDGRMNGGMDGWKERLFEGRMNNLMTDGREEGGKDGWMEGWMK